MYQVVKWQTHILPDLQSENPHQLLRGQNISHHYSLCICRPSFKLFHFSNTAQIMLRFALLARSLAHSSFLGFVWWIYNLMHCFLDLLRSKMASWLSREGGGVGRSTFGSHWSSRALKNCCSASPAPYNTRHDANNCCWRMCEWY